jgi:putative membrane protein
MARTAKMKEVIVRRTLIGAVCALAMPALAAAAAKLDDAQISHIAYTAGAIDVAAGKQALAKSHSGAVRAFASVMVRDHGAVNDQALVLCKKLGVTPQDNPTSASLQVAAHTEMLELSKLKGHEFDQAYLRNEIAFHKTVNNALETTLIPSAQNAELKSLLLTGLKLFEEHEQHAEMLAADLK